MYGSSKEWRNVWTWECRLSIEKHTWWWIEWLIQPIHRKEHFDTFVLGSVVKISKEMVMFQSFWIYPTSWFFSNFSTLFQSFHFFPKFFQYFDFLMSAEIFPCPTFSTSPLAFMEYWATEGDTKDEAHYEMQRTIHDWKLRHRIHT